MAANDLRIDVDDVPYDVLFVDSRGPEAWAESWEQLPEAVRIPAREIEAHLLDLPRSKTIVCYGAGAREVARALRAHGYRAFVLRGGLEAWRDAGRPTEPKGGRPHLMQPLF